MIECPKTLIESHNTLIVWHNTKLNLIYVFGTRSQNSKQNDSKNHGVSSISNELYDKLAWEPICTVYVNSKCTSIISGMIWSFNGFHDYFFTQDFILLGGGARAYENRLAPPP